MTVLRESYSSGDDNSAGAYDSTKWKAQTFTTAIAYRVESVILKLFRVSTPGTITVSIKETDDDGKPTGSDLATVNVDGDTFTADTDGDWVTCTFTVPYLLSADTVYAIVVRKTTTTSGKWFYWRYDGSDSTYSDGAFTYSNNSGSTWNTLSYADDYMFKNYDSLIPPVDVVTIKRLVAVANNEFWYEDI